MREGLPPCLPRVAVGNGLRASLYDAHLCGHDDTSLRFHVFVARFLYWEKDDDHPECKVPWSTEGNLFSQSTDDLAEAKAAYEQAEVYVRTGELP